MPALRLIALLAFATAALLALTASPAFAARGHVFSSSFASEGSGPGQLKEPWGLAVNEATRDVYVADFGNNRVQRFAFNGLNGEYEFASEITAATATATGNLTEGSNVIESLSTSSGAFVAGQTISAAGIPAETKITAIEAGGVRLTISNPVEAGGTGTGVSLTASQSLFKPRALAVDNDPASPSHGDLYVSSGSFEEQVVDKFSPSGEFLGQISELPPAAGTGDLEAGSNLIRSLTISSGVFLEGETISGAGIPSGTKITACAVNGDFNVGCGSGVNELRLSNPIEAGATASAVALTAATGPFELVQGVAVEPSGALFVLERHSFFGNPPTVDRFDSAAANEFQGSCVVSNGATWGLAVDSHDNLYFRNATSGEPLSVVKMSSTCKVLNNNIGVEAPDATFGVSYDGFAVESSTDDLYVDNFASIGRFTPAGAEVERFGAGHLATELCDELKNGLASCLGGLAVSSATGEVFAALGKNAHVAVFGLEPPAAPRIEGESVSAVTDDSATAEAEVNPRSLAGEAPTAYRFEYGPCAGSLATCAASPYPSTTPAGSLPPSFEVQHLSASLESLSPATVYHFRLVAENAHGPAQGAERAFTTRSPGEFALIDGRGWEMASPSDLHGALIEPLGKGGFSAGAATQAAADGGGITYETNAPTESQPAGNPSAAQVLSTRGAGGWSSQDITFPNLTPQGLVTGAELPLFSTDLSLAIAQPFQSTFTPLSEAASEQTAYLRDNASGAYTPLVTGCPESEPCPPAVEAAADVPPGTVFGHLSGDGSPCPPAVFSCGAVFVAATPDFSHAILTARAPLLLGANLNALYEWSAPAPPSERLQLISLLPPASPGAQELPAEHPHLGFNFVVNHLRGAISTDGTRVFFTVGTHLYMRDTVAQKTIQIDLPESGCASCGGGKQNPEFEFASADGSRVFFADAQKLTADAKAYTNVRDNASSGEGADLYVCEIHELACKLTDLAPSGAVVGAINASEDGSSVYFVGNGALLPEAVIGGCSNNSIGGTEFLSATCNLYLERYDVATESWGQPQLVTVLSGADYPTWHLFQVGRTSRVSPDGRWLAFMSQRSLTGYDNRDAVSGRPDQEVYLYDSQRNQLTCASCDPSGARPRGFENGPNGANAPLLGNNPWGGHAWLAASVPAWVQNNPQEALYQPRYLSDSGRLLFDSHDALVSKDSNGTGDVYEFEPEGVPPGERACSPAAANGSVTYRPARPFEVEGAVQGGEEAAGCVGLISSGASSEESAFLDASENGDDVFFLSTDKLSPLDLEGGRTVYDAHVCTASSPCPPPPPPAPPICAGDACQQPAVPPVDRTPGSLTFQGAGNLLQCPKGKVRRGGKCVARRHAKKHHRKKHHSSHRRAANANRRAIR
jgi:DNA-binding beta-propeller fold protein YncE